METILQAIYQELRKGHASIITSIDTSTTSNKEFVSNEVLTVAQNETKTLALAPTDATFAKIQVQLSQVLVSLTDTPYTYGFLQEVGDVIFIQNANEISIVKFGNSTGTTATLIVQYYK